MWSTAALTVSCSATAALAAHVDVLHAVDSTGRSSLQELLHAVNVAERTSSSEASELPLGQWEVEALRGRADLLPPQLLMASPAQSARKLSVEALAGMTDVLFMTGEG